MTQQHPNPRDLIKRLADELDHYRQLLMDDKRETHALATEARAYLSQPEPEGPTDEETELSPAAKAVQATVDAMCWDWGNMMPSSSDAIAAAALEAAADQVVPEQVEPPCGDTEPWPQGYQLMRDAQWEKCQQLRFEILAIAAELRGEDQPSSEEP
jgi:hypothetical protein